MTTAFYPTFRYHQTLAPQGQKFTDRAEFEALSAEWVDTPAKFAPVEAEKAGDIPEIPEMPAKKGRKAKEVSE